MTTLERLRRKDSDQLFRWFCKHAGYYEQPQPFYAVRVGAVILQSKDTGDLFQKLQQHIAATE